MTGIIKAMMDEVDPEWANLEFAKQFDNAFGPNYGCNPDGTPAERTPGENDSPAKNGFLKEQETQARELFIKAGIAVTFTKTGRPVLPTTLLTQEKVTLFKRLLSEYIRDAGTDIHRLAHNPYIFQIAREIYEVLPWDSGNNAHYKQLCLFSQQILGEIQNSMKKTSHLWLKHSAEGIYDCAEKIEAAASPASIPPCSRSFALQYPEGRDVRSFSGLGDSAFIGIFGEEWEFEAPGWVWCRTKNYVKQKHHIFRTYAAGAILPHAGISPGKLR
ncbi:MAG: hypothetical protein A3F13_00985 [Gammaproteobacteria bacterium RIFCSPHIGHO2_12_FULL_40_19]|nr:MAG: hypothetical protein A3F13_00985 [Gammaproteobacteria bacterium RIFCSPHIGHO2_12_FULL_40_19]